MFRNALRLRNSFRAQVKSVRFQSTNNKKPQSERGVNFRNFISVGIISTIILTQVVDAVNKEKPTPRSMSESEYLKQQARLKRKRALLNSDEKQVYFLKSQDIINKDDIKAEGFTIIDPKDLIEKERNDKDSKFYALLNDVDLPEPPRGLITELVGKFLQAQPDGKFIVLNFPRDLQESTHFEDKVVTIKKFIYLGDIGNDYMVVRYYNTVDKVLKITNLNELKAE